MLCKYCYSVYLMFDWRLSRVFDCRNYNERQSNNVFKIVFLLISYQDRDGNWNSCKIRKPQNLWKDNHQCYFALQELY